MRILMTADTVGGVWTYGLELARALGPAGIQFGLATMGRRLSSRQHEEVRALPNVRLFESEYRLEWMQQPWADLAEAGEWLLRLEEHFQPDLIHLNGYVHGALPWRSPSLVIGHSCVLSWWQAVRGEPAPESWDRYRQEVRRGLQAAGAVAAPTAAMLGALDGIYGPLPGSRVIPNGRDPDGFAPAEKEPFVFAAGRLWDEAKNLSCLEAAAPDLLWPAYVAGDPRHPDGHEVACRHTRPLGVLGAAEIRTWYERASIYALPAKYEPFGLSALEAALGGCALVLGDIPSLREVWGEAAVFVSPDSPTELASAVNRLIREPELRERLAGAARSRALELTPERMAAGYLELYRDLVSRSVRAPDPEETLLCAS